MPGEVCVTGWGRGENVWWGEARSAAGGWAGGELPEGGVGADVKRGCYGSLGPQGEQKSGKSGGVGGRVDGSLIQGGLEVCK